MYLIRKKLKNFSAAHRLNKDYTGKCAHLHGHNYYATVLIAAKKFDQFDFVIDFNEITQIFDVWLQEHIDHVTIVSSIDQALLDFLIADQQRYYIIPDGKNTTAEVIAEHLFEVFEKILHDKYPELTLQEIEISETISAQAIFTRRPSIDGHL